MSLHGFLEFLLFTIVLIGFLAALGLVLFKGDFGGKRGI